LSKTPVRATTPRMATRDAADENDVVDA